MVKNKLFSVAIVFFLGAFSQVSAQKGPKSDIRFINDIEVGFGFPEDNNNDVKLKATKSATNINSTLKKGYNVGDDFIEKASNLQFKYSLLLDTEVEAIQNTSLFQLIDEWMGTPYRLGGTSRSGIDCSAFVQTLYTNILGITLPRTSREQYQTTRAISLMEIKEGDLVFFSTRGSGVTHVGYYLHNNKFVHAGSSTGVTVSDLTDPYWSSHFLRAGRIEKVEANSFFSNP